MENCLKLKIFGAFQPVLGALKLVWKYWKLAIFPTDALLLVYFLHRKNLSAIVLSPALTFYWKMQKVFFSHFCPFSGALKIFGEIMKNNQFSADVLFQIFCLDACFLQRKNWGAIILFSVLKIYQKMQKCLRITFPSHFRPFSGCLQLYGEYWKIIKFSAVVLLLAYSLHEKEVKMVLFHVSPKNLLENAECLEVLKLSLKKLAFHST